MLRVFLLTPLPFLRHLPFVALLLGLLVIAVALSSRILIGAPILYLCLGLIASCLIMVESNPIMLPHLASMSRRLLLIILLFVRPLTMTVVITVIRCLVSTMSTFVLLIAVIPVPLCVSFFSFFPF